ncbi:MAG: helix-turn-helix domain-containing protein, partial [Angelakisella sp.]
DVLRINIPSLRERRSDIPLLAESYFVSHMLNTQITDKAREALMQYEWRGNIRQLFNICERLSVLKDGETITDNDVRDVMEGQSAFAPEAARSLPPLIAAEERCDTSARQGEEAVILRTLEQYRYNRKQTAQALGMDRSTLWRKMKEYRL